MYIIAKDYVILLSLFHRWHRIYLYYSMSVPDRFLPPLNWALFPYGGLFFAIENM
jgi:hypothetical protein